MRIYYQINLEHFLEINPELIKAKAKMKLNFTLSNVSIYFINNKIKYILII